MSKATTTTQRNPAPESPDAEVLAFRAPFDERSPLDEIVRRGAQEMLQAAIDVEVQFLVEHAGKTEFWLRLPLPTPVGCDRWANPTPLNPSEKDEGDLSASLLSWRSFEARIRRSPTAISGRVDFRLTPNRFCDNNSLQAKLC